MTTGRINQVRLAKRASATGVNSSRHENAGSEKNEVNFELVEEQLAQPKLLRIVLVVCSSMTLHLNKTHKPREA